MELIESGVLTPFEVTFIDPGLFVQAWIYDMTTGTPVGPVKVNMTELTPGTYYATFTPLAGKTYLLIDRVFTDVTYTVLDVNYPPNSEAAQSVDLGAISTGIAAIPASVLNSLLSGFTVSGSVGAALTSAAYKTACVITGQVLTPQITAVVGPASELTGNITNPTIVAVVTDPDTIEC